MYLLFTNINKSKVFLVQFTPTFHDNPEFRIYTLSEILYKKKRKVLSNRGFVVYLRASIEELVERMVGDKKRPLLQVDDPPEKIRQIVRERDPLYVETADFVFEAQGLSSKSVAHRITINLIDTFSS